MNRPKKPLLVLDTNVFYDFCYLFGQTNFNFNYRINNKINYPKLKEELLKGLKEKRLLIPSTTIFEFVTNLEGKALNSTIEFLKDMSKEYSYNLLLNASPPIFFFEENWETICSNYDELIKEKERILLAKVGSESEVLIIFARFVVLAYLIEKYKNEYSQDIETIKKYFTYNQFNDSMRRIAKKGNAHKLYNDYQNGMSDKKRKEIFEDALQAHYSIMNIYFNFLTHKNDRPGSGDKKTESIQEEIRKWFKKNKNINELQKTITELIIPFFLDGFTYGQMRYIYERTKKLFIDGKKLEKNDAEDFWNLEFILDDRAFLMSFDETIIDIIEKENSNNYNFIKELYL